ncbi:hypothetical protein [uncultured Piscinibacter sp.]|uniref:hypothetical protein n=1 Tax=uncultured Piscinibacter sp. TaxID=1131835 RepID=UPI002630CBBA|nr:hypothetical protein [uncultured Piscinibacter sp.]
MNGVPSLGGPEEGNVTRAIHRLLGTVSTAATVLLAVCGGGGGEAPMGAAAADADDRAEALGASHPAPTRDVWSAENASTTLVAVPSAEPPAPTGPVKARYQRAHGIYWLVDRQCSAPTRRSGFVFIVNKPGADGGRAGLDRLRKFAEGGELWLKSGEATVYRANPDALAALDLIALRIHQQRPDGHFTPWSLHLSDTSRIDLSR